MRPSFRDFNAQVPRAFGTDSQPKQIGIVPKKFEPSAAGRGKARRLFKGADWRFGSVSHGPDRQTMRVTRSDQAAALSRDSANARASLLDCNLCSHQVEHGLLALSPRRANNLKADPEATTQVLFLERCWRPGLGQRVFYPEHMRLTNP
jgi:hypothetical protein